MTVKDVESADQTMHDDIEMDGNLNQDRRKEQNLDLVVHKINDILERAKVSKKHSLQKEFKEQINAIPTRDLDDLCVGSVTVFENAIVSNEILDEYDNTLSSLIGDTPLSSLIHDTSLSSLIGSPRRISRAHSTMAGKHWRPQEFNLFI